MKKCDTIGQYFSKIENLSNEIFIDVDDFLEDKIIPKVWILVPGDDVQETDRIVKFLTKGVKYELERLLVILDDPKNDSNYLKEWREKREKADFLMRLLHLKFHQY